MINIYEYLEYRDFLKDWLKSQKNEGHGLRSKLAEKGGISSTMLSLILSGSKELTTDQAVEMIELLGLATHEEEYFLELIDLSRAANHKLKTRILKRLAEKKIQSQKFSSRLQEAKELEEVEKAIFYSSWLYSGIRNLTSIEEYGDAVAIAQRLNMPLPMVSKVIEFLVANNLCAQENGRLVPGVQKTYLSPDSPFVNIHHRNWRQKGFDKMQFKKTSDLFFTGPVTLSQEDVVKIRGMLPKMIEEMMKVIWPSKSEKTYCLNIDWFEW